MMDFTADVQEVKRLLEKAEYTAAATACVKLIERVLRQVLIEETPKLQEEDRQKVRKVEQKTGSNGQGLENFTMGQLIRVMYKSDFLDGWTRITGRDPTNIRLIHLDKLRELRNNLIHQPRQVLRAEAEFLFNCLQAILEDVDNQSKTAALMVLNESHDIDGQKDIQIVVSYARADDQSSSQNQKGWITVLTDKLRGLLELEQSRRDESMRVTPDIVNIIEQTSFLLVFLSRNYAVSDWCQKESHQFLNTLQTRILDGLHICIVECDEYATSHRPLELGNSEGLRFWEIISPDQNTSQRLTPNTQNYYDQLGSLALEIKTRFRNASPPPPPPHNTAFLTNVTDDLYFDREEVKRYLLQTNIKVLPESYYPLEPQAYQQAMRDDLSKSELFVQLLSAFPHNPALDLPQGYARCQYELALDMNVPILQWHHPDLDIENLAEAQQELFRLSSVRGDISLEGLKKEIVEWFQKQQESKALPGLEGRLVLVNPGINDEALLEWALKVLGEEDIEYINPCTAPSGPSFRATVEEWVSECRGLIMTYGQNDSRCFHQTLKNVRKIVRNRSEQPLSAYVICDPAPEQKQLFNIKFRGLRTLEYGSYPDERRLRKFIQSL